jgi:hypothetical protein
MMKSFLFRKISCLGFLLLALVYSGAAGCGGDGQGNILQFPAILAIDSLLNRVFVIDSQGNGLNLIDPSNNRIILNSENDPLLDDEDPLLLPLFPSDAAVAGIGGGVSRIFVIGVNDTPSQSMTVLDYSDAGGLSTAPISPVLVPGSALDLLGGIAVDPLAGRVFVTNSTSGMLHFFDVSTGLEDALSPIAIGGNPAPLSVDNDSALLAVGNKAATEVAFIDLSDLTLPPVVLNTGVFVRDVAVATNSTGSVLFLSGSMENVAQVYRLNLADLSTSLLLSEILPTAPSVPPPDPELLTGNLNAVAAGRLIDGRVAGFFTQSTGDVLAVDLSPDLSTLVPTLISIGAFGAEDIAGLLNTAGQTTTVYFASPGFGGVTVIDPLLNEFTDQID